MEDLDLTGLRPLGSGGADEPSDSPLDLTGLKPVEGGAGFTEGAGIFGRSLAQGAVKGVGSVAKAAALGPEFEAAARRQLTPDQLGPEANQDYSLLAKPYGKEVLARERQQAAALARLTEEQSVPIKERGAYKAGEDLQQWADQNIPVSPEEREKYPITSQTGAIIGGAGPVVLASSAASMVGGPAAGLAVATGLMAAQSAGDEFDRARDALEKRKAKGEDVGNVDERAAHAAGLSGEINGVIGALPVGVILAPVRNMAPQLTGRLWATLTHAAESGVTFTTVGEAQHWLGEQLAQSYDPTAHYDFDYRRVVAGLIAGGFFGGVHAALERHPEDAGRNEAVPEQSHTEAIGDMLNELPDDGRPPPPGGGDDVSVLGGERVQRRRLPPNDDDDTGGGGGGTPETPENMGILLGEAAPNIPPHRVTAADGTAIDVAPVVVEADQLLTSQDQGYDPGLQPRQRDRAVSHAQVRDIATNLDPERLGYSAEADRGAPIVGPDGMVESGNGRVLALRRVYWQNGDAAEAYRDWLVGQGVDISNYRNPVLVRQRLTPMAPEDRADFTVAANQAATLSMSAPERAMADARLLDNVAVGLIRNPEDLASPGNRAFVRRFIASLPQSEQGAMADARGALSSEGLTRIRNAVLAKAYDDTGILARIAESTNDEVKSISNAMTAAAPEWARLRSEVAAGRVRPDIDVTADLLEAVKRTADLRSRGERLDEYLAQQDAFNQMPDAVAGFMRSFYDPKTGRAASAKRISDMLRFYAQEAAKVTADKGLALDMTPVDSGAIMRLAEQKQREAHAETISERSRAGNGQGSEAAGGEERGSRLGSSGADTPQGRNNGYPGEVVRAERPRKGELGPDLFAPRQPEGGLQPGAEGTNIPKEASDVGQPESGRVREGTPEVPGGAPARRVRQAAAIRGPEQLSLFGGGDGVRSVFDANDAVRTQPGGAEATVPGPGDSVTKPPARSGRDRSTRDRAPAVTGLREAEKKIAERSRSNYRITPEDRVGVGGPKEKVRANIDAIRILKALEDERRDATPEEKAKLVKYVGWGAFAQDIFASHKPEWKAERDAFRALVTDEEFEAARASTLNAHFTSPDVVSGMWDALNHLGYNGGKALEPAVGIGHFIGLIPDKVAPKTAWTAVDNDPLSGRMTKALYGGAEVAVQGFETLKRPSNYYDLAISNVPFGDFNLTEKPYGSFPIHDFFFVKSLDKVRPGGVVAFITSRYTMDRLDPATRRLLSKNSDLVGAIRLPGGNKGAFAGNAGTQVTTDILFLRKKAPGEAPFPGAAWTDTKEIKTPEGPVKVNEYFADHPEMMLGEMRLQGSMYREAEPVLIGSSEGLQDRILTAAGNMPKGAFLPRGTSTTEPIRGDEIGAGIKDGSFFLKDSNLYQRREGQGHPHELRPDDQDRVTRLIGMRDTINDLLGAQLGRTDGDASALRERLQDAYDDFVKKHGPINKEERTVTSRVNKAGEPVVITRYPNIAKFMGDPDAWKVAAIENYDPETGKAKRADIQTKDVIAAPREREINGPSDALAASLNDTAGVDLDHIAQSLGLDSHDAVIKALGDTVYQNPDGRKWETADAYLSGNVVKKLEDARAIAEDDKSYLRNVAALEKVQPEPLTASDITAQFGAPWIPEEVYKDFLTEVLGASQVKVARIPVTGQWRVSMNGASRDAVSKYGTPDLSVEKIADAAINNHQITVTDPPNRDGRRAVNQKKTEEARIKAELLKEAFTGDPEKGIDGWVFSEPERAQRLEGIFNRTFNNLVSRKFDGSHLTLPGLNPDFATRQHRKDAVWRMIQSGNTLLAHVVGSGKTATMIAGGMEQKRLGLISKPAYVIPNHMLEQFSREFLQAYPDAKILVAQKDEMTRDNRKAFLAKVSSNDWDGVIITHDAFGRIPMGPEFRQRFIRDQLDELQRILETEKVEDKRSVTVKQLEKAKKKLQDRLTNLINEERKDTGTSFEESGIDHLFVDEAHKFKNLSFVTRLNRVKGLAQGDSQRAEDLFLKIRYLEQNRPGRSAVFATGTPISNTMAELWTMQRYLQLDKLKEADLETFDAWASTFGRVTNNMELSADGRTLKDVSSFSKFVNVPELISLYSEISDTKTADMLNLPRPEVKTRRGAPGIEIVEAEPSSQEEAHIDSLIKLAESLKGKRPEKGQPNMLSVVTEGRKVATDGRLIGGHFDFNPNGKIAKAVTNIARIYKEGNDPERPDAKVQMVFLDMGVPKSRTASPLRVRKADDGFEVFDPKREDSGAIGGTFGTEKEASDYAQRGGAQDRIDLYADIKKRLVEQGVPAKEIAAIHDATDDEKKARLFQKVRTGEIRVLLGSTEKMGVGTNVQNRLIAMHHLDAPWKTAEVEQRDGRIQRQGNKNQEVQIYRYVTKRSFDAFMWQNLDRKARFIGQVLSGAKGSRHAEDIDNPLPEAAEMKAAASGDPRIMEHAELERQVRALAAQKRVFETTRSQATGQLGTAKSRIEQYEAALPAAKEDAGTVQNLAGGEFKVELGQGVFTERKEAGQAILNQLLAVDPRTFYTPKIVNVGKLSGFDMNIQMRSTWNGTAGQNSVDLRATLSLKGKSGYASPTDNVINAQTDPGGLIRRFENILGAIKQNPDRLTNELKTERDDAERLKKTLDQKWPKEKEYRDTVDRLATLQEDMKAGDKRKKDETDKAFAKRVVDKRQVPDSLPEEHGKYFKMPEGTVTVPIDKLISSKSAAENMQGAENGAKRMAAAAAGELSKRAPIDVMAMPDGNYIVLDGNGTMTSIKKYGWQSLPVHVVEPEPFTPGIKAIGQEDAETMKRIWSATSPIRTVDDLYARAQKNQDALIDFGHEIAEATGAKFKIPPGENRGLKGRERVEEKITKKNLAPSSVRDVVRGGFAVDTPQQGDAVVRRLAEHFEVIDEGWGVTPVGYFDRKVMFKSPDGQIGEVQLWHPDLLKAKLEKGTRLYVGSRSLPPGHPMAPVLDSEMVKLYSGISDQLPAEWKALLGSGGSLENRSLKAAAESTRPLNPTSDEMAGFQESPENTQASPGTQTKGSPSNTPNFRNGATGTSNENIGISGSLGNGTVKAQQPVATPFYSAVQRAVESMKQERASPEQWLATIKNRPGVKPEELEWLGLEDWLKEQKGTITKQAVADYVLANQIEVKEVQKGTGTPPNEAARRAVFDWIEQNDPPAFPDARDAINDIRNGETGAVANLEALGLPDNLLEPFRNYAQGESGAKFSGYQLPGGENYRELLLTLPHTPRDNVRPTDTASAPFMAEWNKLNAQIDSLRELKSNAKDAASDRYQTGIEHVEQLRERLHEKMVDATIVESRGRLGGEGFTSSHWDEPNVIAHIRFNDRTIDGKRTLFMEEIQSDWHQAGRRRGYDDPAARAAVEKKLNDAGYPISGEDARSAASDGVITESEAQTLSGRNYVPDAPFKTTWPELALKRMIRYAAENGYEQVAWTNGATQAARYDLSKHVDRVTYAPESNHLRAYKNGTVVMRQTVKPDQLPDHVGKDVAEKLLQTRVLPDSAFQGARAEDVHSLSGLDLRVGGEGMSGFYDKMLPAAANKLTKKYGAKVGRSEFTDAKTRENLQVEATHDGYTILDHQDREHGHFQTEDEAYRALKDMEGEKAVHTLTITPELRESATHEGFPLFRKGPETTGGRDTGPKPGEKVFRIGREAYAHFKPTERYTAAEKKIADAVAEIGKKLAPQANIIDAAGLRLGGRPIWGAFLKSEAFPHLIAWSLESPDHIGTLRHEVIHHLKDAGLIRPDEWKKLSDAAVSEDWIKKYNIDDRYSGDPHDVKVEEAIAERFREWRGDRSIEKPGLIRQAFQRFDLFMRRVAAAARQFLGRDATANDVFTRIETGEVGRRQMITNKEEGAPRAQTPGEEARRRRDLTRTAAAAIGSRSTPWGRLVSISDALRSRAADYAKKIGTDEMVREMQMKVAPMAARDATVESRATAKEYMNDRRQARQVWNKIDKYLVDNFDYETRKKMWEAADEQSVAMQQGRPTAGIGLDRLAPEQRKVVEMLQKRGIDNLREANTLKMIDSVGLPSYAPRMLVKMVNDKFERGVGAGAEVVKDIRTLALTNAKLEDAIATRRLVDTIADVGNRSGNPTVRIAGVPVRRHGAPETMLSNVLDQLGRDVSTTTPQLKHRKYLTTAETEAAARRVPTPPADAPKWFTLPHPAFTRIEPRMVTDPDTGRRRPMRDENGDVVFDRKMIEIRKDFEGPLRSVLSNESGRIMRGLMELKGKAMAVIMMSPLIHNQVEWGRALPAAPGKVVTFQVYTEGNKVANDPAQMKEAIAGGTVPIGGHGFMQDIVSIAEAPTVRPGRSWTAKGLGYGAQALGHLTRIYDPRAGADAVRRSVDWFGHVWHDVFLWDRIRDLQMGLWSHLRQNWIDKGYDPYAANVAASHFANRYAGALPIESMSRNARGIANVLLFSRSFTLGNLGAYKDAVLGLPRDAQALIQKNVGYDELKKIQSAVKRKSLAMLAVDAGLFYSTLSALQSSFHTIGIGHTLGTLGGVIAGGALGGKGGKYGRLAAAIGLGAGGYGLASVLGASPGTRTLEDEMNRYWERFTDLLTRIHEHPGAVIGNPFKIIDNTIGALSSTADNEPGKKTRLLIGYQPDGTGIYARMAVGKVTEELLGWGQEPNEMLHRKLSTFARPVNEIWENNIGFGRKAYDPKGDTGGELVQNIIKIAGLLIGSQVPLDTIEGVKDWYQGGPGSDVSGLKAVAPMLGTTISKGFPGGPELGVVFDVKAKQAYRIQQEMPDIQKQLRRGEVDEAVNRMNDLGISQGLQKYYIKIAQNPASRLTKRQMDDFMRTATPEQKKQFFSLQGRERAAGGRVNADNINHNPTEAQKESGNYAHDKIHILGLRISIENAKGSMRHGIGADGKRWAAKLAAHYGDIKGTTGADNDPIDCFIGPHRKSPHVFAIDQINPETGKYDEGKMMFCFASERQARRAYECSFSDGKGAHRIGKLTSTTVPQFKNWLEHGDTKAPFAHVTGRKDRVRDILERHGVEA